MTNQKYDEKIRKELEWYERTNQDVQGSLMYRFFHSKLFFSPERNYLNFAFAKKQMQSFIISKLNNITFDKTLIAPCGTGDDLKYLESISKEFYGIDLSPIALQHCPENMIVKTGDILKSGYPDDTFDLIASPLFFHHVVDFGFDGFLKEFYRILKKRGYIVILEPSVFYPLNAITRPLKKLTRNVYGEVEDEKPFNPMLLTRCLKRVGFTNIELCAASFSHCSFYIPLAKIINTLTRPFLKNNNPLKYFAWIVIFWAQKQ